VSKVKFGQFLFLKNIFMSLLSILLKGRNFTDTGSKLCYPYCKVKSHRNVSKWIT